MKFKLDENIGMRTQDLFRAAGHAVLTVREEALQGCSDRVIYDTCCVEQLCLVTFDLDFADVTRFSPAKAAGIVVIRVPKNPSRSLLDHLVSQFLGATEREPLEKRLWIVETGRIRVHESDIDEEW